MFVFGKGNKGATTGKQIEECIMCVYYLNLRNPYV